MPMPALRITDAAADRLRGLMADKDGVVGIRVGVKTAGCSGLAYTMEMADDVAKHDEVIEEKGVRILIDPKAILFLIEHAAERGRMGAAARERICRDYALDGTADKLAALYRELAGKGVS